jgi:hypothetical protein
VSDFDKLYEDVMNAIPPDTFSKEATAVPKRVPTGTYKLTIAEKTLEVGEETFKNGNPNPNAGRVMVRCKATLEKDGVKAGTAFPDLSPVEKRTEKGRLDAPSQLWGHAIKTLDLVGSPNQAVFDALGMYPFKSRVELTVKSPDGKFTNSPPGKTQDEWEAELTSAGYDPAAYAFFNQVRSLGRWDG